MEVKIKTDKGLVDATIEMFDGVMVVSQASDYEPKDGDFVAIYNIGLDVWMPAIYKVSDPICGATVYCIYNGNKKLRVNRTGIKICNGIRLANEEERLFLLGVLEYEGYKWDAEKKEVRKKKWKPGVGELFYFPRWNGMSHAFYCMSFKYMSEETLEKNMDDWMFQTEEECKEICEKLNEKIKEVEP